MHNASPFVCLTASLFIAACSGTTPVSPAPKAPPSEPQTLLSSTPPEAPRHACARPQSTGGARPLAPVDQSGSVALATHDGRSIAYAADEDSGAIITFDIEARRAIAATPIEDGPAHLLVLPDGRVAVTSKMGNRLSLFGSGASPDAPLSLLCSAPLPAEPIAMAMAPGGETMFVTSGWGHALTAIKTGDLALVGSVSLPREPRAAVVDGEGKRVFVTHAVGGRVSVVELEEGGAMKARPTHTPAPNGLRLHNPGSHAHAILRTGKGRLLIPMVAVEPGMGLQSQKVYGAAGGRPMMPFVNVIAERTEIPLSRDVADPGLSGPLADVGGREKACMLPKAAVLDGDEMLVACLGIDALVVLEARARDPMSAEVRRYKLPEGPTGVAVDAAKRRAVVYAQFEHALAVVALDATQAPTVIAQGPSQPGWPDKALARGRVLFHKTSDPRISADGRSCAGCHPDGRDDGLSWLTPSGTNQTIMLAGRLGGTAPFGWMGERRDLKKHIHDTMRRLGGRGALSDRDHEDLDALVRYVASMRGPSLKGALGAPDAALVARGKELFESDDQKCASCHPGGGTDGAMHSVKSGLFGELPLDTPSLRFIGGTAPYFHDGRFSTLDELLQKVDGKMGHTAALTADDRRALVAYLETL